MAAASRQMVELAEPFLAFGGPRCPVCVLHHYYTPCNEPSIQLIETDIEQTTRSVGWSSHLPNANPCRGRTYLRALRSPPVAPPIRCDVVVSAPAGVAAPAGAPYGDPAG
ncbi:hypothetical protein GCM10012275_46590 [Longimycelium tulufanense]|uniref:Uncharacterized protein n=1 Tax=Longimycelium tulufanense TaxID=907463 RepID=A0A8J3CJB6_9PSEU|nr:hypothetical protein GCM10012275_46590 [Longimycelium tulufanense]